MLAVFAAVSLVECPKCDKRMRISEDGKEEFVNLLVPQCVETKEGTE